MPRYAEKTSVSSMESRNEIERVLTRYGASAFTYGWDEDRNLTIIGFRLKTRQIKFTLPLPSRNDKAITHTPAKNQARNLAGRNTAYEQAVKQRWRALLLIIKAKLEAIDAGIVTLEDEFLSQTMLSDGSTIAEWAGPQVDEVYRTGGMPQLLPGATHKALNEGKVPDAQ